FRNIFFSKTCVVFFFTELFVSSIFIVTFSVLQTTDDESDSTQYPTYYAVPPTIFHPSSTSSFRWIHLFQPTIICILVLLVFSVNPYMNSLRSPDVNILSSYADERSWKRALGPRPLRFG
ncbi:unnamed protein product, partial [Brugia pahangi]|uniref:Cytochrome b n=1 Tax=Brugia pahangi TaxID=6280 RepID=A0A0N4T9I5_BRUPA